MQLVIVVAACAVITTAALLMGDSVGEWRLNRLRQLHRRHVPSDANESSCESGDESADQHMPREGLSVVLMTLVARLKSGIPLAKALELTLGSHVFAGSLNEEAVQESLLQRKLDDETTDSVRETARGLLAACQLTERIGCRASDAIEAVRSVYQRRKLQADLKKNALAAPVATVRMLSALPAITVLLAEFLGAHPLTFLVSSWAGLCCLVAGLCCYGLGLGWMSALIRDSASVGNVNAHQRSFRSRHVPHHSGHADHAGHGDHSGRRLLQQTARYPSSRSTQRVPRRATSPMTARSLFRSTSRQSYRLSYQSTYYSPPVQTRMWVPSASLILELVAVALRQGSSIPHALQAVGEVCGPLCGAGLQDVAETLLTGASWREAWLPACECLDEVVENRLTGEGSGVADGSSNSIESTQHTMKLLRDALRPCWEEGTSAQLQLAAAAERLDCAERMNIEQSAARLSVRLLMPMGLCFLPAFLLLSIVPTVASFATQL